MESRANGFSARRRGCDLPPPLSPSQDSCCFRVVEPPGVIRRLARGAATRAEPARRERRSMRAAAEPTSVWRAPAAIAAARRPTAAVRAAPPTAPAAARATAAASSRFAIAMRTAASAASPVWIAPRPARRAAPRRSPASSEGFGARASTLLPMRRLLAVSMVLLAAACTAVGSPALGAASSCLATDQRGHPRPPAACTAGAVEGSS